MSLRVGNCSQLTFYFLNEAWKKNLGTTKKQKRWSETHRSSSVYVVKLFVTIENLSCPCQLVYCLLVHNKAPSKITQILNNPETVFVILLIFYFHVISGAQLFCQLLTCHPIMEWHWLEMWKYFDIIAQTVNAWHTGAADCEKCLIYSLTSLCGQWEVVKMSQWILMSNPISPSGCKVGSIALI